MSRALVCGSYGGGGNEPQRLGGDRAAGEQRWHRADAVARGQDANRRGLERWLSRGQTRGRGGTGDGRRWPRPMLCTGGRKNQEVEQKAEAPGGRRRGRN
jgi:hypothetical protein